MSLAGFIEIYLSATPTSTCFLFNHKRHPPHVTSISIPLCRNTWYNHTVPDELPSVKRNYQGISISQILNSFILLILSYSPNPHLHPTHHHTHLQNSPSSFLHSPSQPNLLPSSSTDPFRTWWSSIPTRGRRPNCGKLS